MPRVAVELLARILAHVADGQGVSVVPAHAELTTQQAADLARRNRARSLLEYLARDDQGRREVADELTQLNQDMGLL